MTPASLYGINAYAVAYDRLSNTLVATDRAGFLTIYNVPRPALAQRLSPDASGRRLSDAIQ